MSQNTKFGMKFIEATKATWKEDKLDRAKYARQLTNLVKNMDKPFVMTLSAPWGSGKTFFLNAWRDEIAWNGEENTDKIPCVYFSAWEYDCVDDPLLAIVGKMQEELAPLLGYEVDLAEKDIAENSETQSDNKRKNPFSKLTAVTKSIFTKENLCKIGWTVSGRILSKITADVFEEVIKDTVAEGILKEEDVDKLFHKTRQAVESSPKQKLEAVLEEKKSFIATVKDIVAECQEKLGKSYPILIMIDELDRCRPDYVISLLERIKNLFEVDGIFFVLAIDREQLYSVVEHTFGVKKEENGRDNRAIYLQKFINMDFELPEPNLVAYANCFINTIKGISNLMIGGAIFERRIRGHCSLPCSDILYIFKSSGYSSLRDFEHFIQKLNVIVLCSKDISYSEILIVWKTLLDNKEIKTLYNDSVMKFSGGNIFYNNSYNFIDNVIMNLNLYSIRKENILNNPDELLTETQEICKKLVSAFIREHHLIQQDVERKIMISTNYKWLKDRFAGYLTLIPR